jgi:hypothetical protein
LQLAWLSPQLEDSCVSGVHLRAVADGQVAAAEDLLHVVAHAPRLANLVTFQSVRIGVNAGNLTLSIEEVEMHVRPLSPDGVPRAVLDRAALPDHASSQALLVQDFHIRGRSILRPAI